MKSVVVQYKTRSDRGDDNQRLVEKVFEELSERDPGGLRYATLRLADGVSFAHIAVVKTADGSNPIGQISAFAEFQREIGDRCADPPAAEDATVIGSYRFFSD